MRRNTRTHARTKSLKEWFGKLFHFSCYTHTVQFHHEFAANGTGCSTNNGRNKNEQFQHSTRFGRGPARSVSTRHDG